MARPILDFASSRLKIFCMNIELYTHVHGIGLPSLRGFTYAVQDQDHGAHDNRIIVESQKIATSDPLGQSTRKSIV